MFIYSNSGQFESYIAFDFKAMEILPLPNGNYLIKKEVITPETKYIEWPIYIYESDLKEIKEVDKYFRLDEFKVDTTKFPVPVLIRSVSNGLIYSGYGKRGYEIWVYDFNGNLWDIQYATARKGRIYCLQKKPNGYKDLVVYKMIWE